MKSVMLLFLGAALLTGCVTDRRDAQVTRDIADNESDAMQQERLIRLSGQVQVLIDRADSLERELASIKGKLDQIQTAGGNTNAAQIAQLQKMIADVDKARQADKQVILDEVAKQLDIIAKRSAPPPKPTANPTPAEQGYEHIVKSGETISAIAHAYGVSVDSILKANNIKDATKVPVGIKLFVPKK